MQKLLEKRGNANLIAIMIAVLVIITLLMFCISIFGQASKLDDLQQIAQLMAREISLRGAVDSVVNDRLTELEELYKVTVEMEVNGDFIGTGSKLRLESRFEVLIKSDYSYGVAGIMLWRKEGTYVRKAAGIVEEYHK